MAELFCREQASKVSNINKKNSLQFNRQRRAFLAAVLESDVRVQGRALVS